MSVCMAGKGQQQPEQGLGKLDGARVRGFLGRQDSRTRQKGSLQ